MPIEIFELVVKATVNESTDRQNDTEKNARSNKCKDSIRERNAAIAEQTGEILERRKER